MLRIFEYTDLSPQRSSPPTFSNLNAIIRWKVHNTYIYPASR